MNTKGWKKKTTCLARKLVTLETS